jgi:hypothetical protein
MQALLHCVPLPRHGGPVQIQLSGQLEKNSMLLLAVHHGAPYGHKDHLHLIGLHLSEGPVNGICHRKSEAWFDTEDEIPDHSRYTGRRSTYFKLWKACWAYRVNRFVAEVLPYSKPNVTQ